MTTAPGTLTKLIQDREPIETTLNRLAEEMAALDPAMAKDTRLPHEIVNDRIMTVEQHREENGIQRLVTSVSRK